MIKEDIVNAISEKTGFTKTNSEIALAAFQETVAEALIAGDKVKLVGFGAFEVSERPSRVGRNPKTGETITIPASKSPRFKAGKVLKDAINAQGGVL